VKYIICVTCIEAPFAGKLVAEFDNDAEASEKAHAAACAFGKAHDANRVAYLVSDEDGREIDGAIVTGLQQEGGAH
jgi:hypothetical protein